MDALLPADASALERRRLLIRHQGVSVILLLDPVFWEAVVTVADALLIFKTLTGGMLNCILFSALPEQHRERLRGKALDFEPGLA